MRARPPVHRVTGTTLPVNAYLIETPNGVVLVDSALTVSDGRTIRARIAETGKPLLGGVVTHAHPDHYGALREIVGDARVPIVALAGVSDAIRRDDAIKERILRPMFGEEWPRDRMFPTQIVSHGDSVTFDGVTLRVEDFGPGESPHDSIWLLEGTDVVFVGDLVYNRMHAYLADGYYYHWLQNLERARALIAPTALLHPGHGDIGTPGLLDAQRDYVHAFVRAVRSTESLQPAETAVEEVTNRMKDVLPAQDLLFLMQISVSPMREILATPRHL